MEQENQENQSICRLATKKQSLDDMYSVPANFLEIDVINPQTTIIAGKKKFTDYEIRMRVSAMIFSVESRFLLLHILSVSLFISTSICNATLFSFIK